MIVPRGGETIFAAAILYLREQLVGENWFPEQREEYF
jgi:hypothetical protein